MRVHEINDTDIRAPGALRFSSRSKMNRGLESNHALAYAAPVLIRCTGAKKNCRMTSTYQHAFDTIVEIRDRYALEGRGPDTLHVLRRDEPQDEG